MLGKAGNCGDHARSSYLSAVGHTHDGHKNDNDLKTLERSGFDVTVYDAELDGKSILSVITDQYVDSTQGGATQLLQ